MQSSEHKRLIWLAEMYQTYAADLQRYIYSKVGEPFLAEDLTSTVFLKALRWMREDQSEESARGWLYATARTTIADHWQTLGQYEMHTLADLEPLFSFQPESAESAQQKAEVRVQRLLGLLPERERRVLTLRYLQGYSASEIAQALGTNSGHIRVLQLRALRHAAQVERQTQKRNSDIMQEQDAQFNSYAQLFTAESLRALDLARTEALILKHQFIGTEHLLWGLASEGSLTAFLTPLGITSERLHVGIIFIYDRQAQWAHPDPQDNPSTDAPPEALKMLTPRAKQMLILAGEEMKSQGEKNIRPTHLLLGLMNEGAGIGAGLLRSLGVSLLQARTALTPPTATQICSFCGRTGSQVKRIFLAEYAVGNAVSTSLICDQCVERFHSMLGQL